MEQNKAERLNENVTEKCVHQTVTWLGEMCSPADADTCGDGMFIVQTPRSEASCECETGYG